jgi:hypothetical protein
MTSVVLRSAYIGGIALGAIGLASSAVLMSTPAGADPKLPSNVWIQCGQFSGPAETFPHDLADCVSRQGQVKSGGKGQTFSNGDGTETLKWTAPFQKGESLQAINITRQPVDPPTGGCPVAPVALPVEVNVSAEVGPGANNLSGSPVRATICTDGTVFELKPGTFFTIFKK